MDLQGLENEILKICEIAKYNPTLIYLWDLLETPIYYITSIILEWIIIPTLNFMVNNLLLTVILIPLIPLTYSFLKEVLYTAYKMVVS